MTRRVAIVCGGRDVTPTLAELVELHEILEANDITTVRTGGAKGVDDAVHEFIQGIWERQRMPADWKAHGRYAGPKRNQAMIDAGDVVLVIAWPGGRGTENMRSLAQRARIPIHEIGKRATG